MKLYPTTIICDLSGLPIKEQIGPDKFRDLTLGNAIANALQGTYEDESGLPADMKIKRYELAKKFVRLEEVEITVDEASMIKTLVNKGYTTLGVGAIFEIIEAAATTS